MRVLIALFAASLVTTAFAGDESKDKPMQSASAEAKFDKLDSNGDDQLSRTEARRDDELAAQFASVDQNSDDVVSKAEYTAAVSTQEPRPQRKSYPPDSR